MLSWICRRNCLFRYLESQNEIPSTCLGAYCPPRYRTNFRFLNLVSVSFWDMFRLQSDLNFIHLEQLILFNYNRMFSFNSKLHPFYHRAATAPLLSWAAVSKLTGPWAHILYFKAIFCQTYIYLSSWWWAVLLSNALFNFWRLVLSFKPTVDSKYSCNLSEQKLLQELFYLPNSFCAYFLSYWHVVCSVPFLHYLLGREWFSLTKMMPRI